MHKQMDDVQQAVPFAWCDRVQNQNDLTRGPGEWTAGMLGRTKTGEEPGYFKDYAWGNSIPHHSTIVNCQRRSNVSSGRGTHSFVNEDIWPSCVGIVPDRFLRSLQNLKKLPAKPSFEYATIALPCMQTVTIKLLDHATDELSTRKLI